MAPSSYRPGAILAAAIALSSSSSHVTTASKSGKGSSSYDEPTIHYWHPGPWYDFPPPPPPHFWHSVDESTGKSGKSGSSKGSKGSSDVESFPHHPWGPPPPPPPGWWGPPPPLPPWDAEWSAPDDDESSGKSGKGSSKSSKSKSSKGSSEEGIWVWVDDSWSSNDDDAWSAPDKPESSGKSGKSSGSGSEGGNSDKSDDDDEVVEDDDNKDYFTSDSSGGDNSDESTDDDDDNKDTSSSSSSSSSGHEGDYNHVTDYCHASCDDDDVCTYTAQVDLFASEFGFFHFEECADSGNMPTITMELGKTYRFVQSDITNYIHPLGFAYEPDGALADADEVEEEYLAYQLDGKDIGLDVYEPNFAHPIEEWATDGEYYVEVTLPQDFNSTKDLFYFCHIHRYLGGRIKLTRNGKIIQPTHLPVHNELPPPPSSYDKQCGTYGLVHEEANPGQRGDSWAHHVEADYRLPHPECPHTFVCEDGKSTFSSCLDAINCHMFNGMTTYENYGDVALFLQQMIPHHQNAVNMAKSLLLTWSYSCNPQDLGSSSAECLMENIIRSIINGQNAQIQTMRDLLDKHSWPEFDHCDLPMKGGSESGMDSEYDEIDNSRYNGERNLQEEKHSNVRRGLGDDGICRGSCSSDNGEEVCVFTMGVDIFASDLGGFYFEECGSDNIYPIIGVEVGKTYRFIQEDKSNYYHPLGFAYHPDGAHVGKEEVEEDYLTYKLDAKDVGLDGYEPLFFHSAAEWTDYGTFSVELNYDKDYDQDLFYFCHIHAQMSGRIKLLKNGKPVQSANLPDITYSHPEPSEYDKACGTYGLEPFQLPHAECPEAFVCDKSSEFAGCLETMNCYMMLGMTTGGNEGDVALFNHQMIPHHINAVNMAKALLKTGSLQCSSLSDTTDDCTLEGILWEIVNNQNLQIQQMYEVLSLGMDEPVNDCVVAIHSESDW